MIARPKRSTRLFWNGTSLWLLLCSSTFLNILTSCRYTFNWVIKWYHSISLIFTFTTLLRIKTIFGDPEPWSQLDSSLWRSKNLLLCSECQAKWRCCLGGLDGKGYWNHLGLRHWSIIAKDGRKATTSQQRSSKYPISILEEGNVFAISRSPRHRDQWKACGATTRLPGSAPYSR